MIQTRRTLADAIQPPNLPSEAMLLIKEGTPKPQKTDIATKASENKEVQPPHDTPLKVTGTERQPTEQKRDTIHTVESTKFRKLKVGEERGSDIVTMVSLTFRVPSTIPPALLKAASERKLNRTIPYTQQDIVADALANWLRKNGYLSNS